ncbi:MAG: hypothetical protein ACTII7_09775 [Galactobacter sp.]
MAFLVSGARADSPIDQKLADAKFGTELDLEDQGHANTTRRFPIEGGEVYFKSFKAENTALAARLGFPNRQQPIHEVAAWQMAQDLGPEYTRIVAPCAMVEHEGQWGSASWGAVGNVWRDTPIRARRSAVKDPAFQQQMVDAAFFDTLLGNRDRHKGNYLADHRGLQLIDHGFAFNAVHEPQGSEFVRTRWALGRLALTDREKQVLDRVLDTKNPPEVLRALEKPRAEALLARAKKMRSSGMVLSPPK